MKFKPTWWKSIVSVVVIIGWYLFNSVTILSYCSRASIMCNCLNYKLPSLLPNCCGCGAQLSQLILQIILILLPGIIIYFIWSLVQKNKKFKNIQHSHKKRRR
jgi:hypothetical protein